MNNTKPLKSKGLMQYPKEKGILYSNSTIKCVHCKAVFPIDYDKCPQCEVDELWKTVKIQYEKNYGGKQN